MPDFLVSILPAVTVETANGFVVVSKFKLARPAVPPYAYDYDYRHYDRQADADEHFRDLLDGEYEGWEAVAILPSLKGVPLGAKKVL